MPPGGPVADPHDVAAAERIAVQALARRGFSRAELRELLARRGVADPLIEALLARCVERGWIDEGALALGHALAAIAKGRARERVLRELEARGLAAVAATAWERAVEEHGGDAEALLDAAVRKCVERCGGRLGPRDYRRVYNALLRAGHAAEALRAALESHREVADPADDPPESDDPESEFDEA